MKRHYEVTGVNQWGETVTEIVTVELIVTEWLLAWTGAMLKSIKNREAPWN